jgi:Clp amino terminal domain, pathogenicity island component
VAVTYDQHVQAALNYTRDEAARRNDPYIRPDHLFVALIREREGGAAQLLSEPGIDLDKARYRVGPIRHPPPRPPGSPGWEPPGFTSHLCEALAWAEEEAARLGQAEVRTEHLLLGLIAVPIWGAAGLLRICGADPDFAWRRAYEMLGAPLEQHRSRPEPPPFTPPGPRLEDLRRVVPVAESRSAHGHTLTVLSLEDYADGFLVRTHLRTEAQPVRDRGFPEWPPKSHIGPRLIVTTADDRGRSYMPSAFSQHWSWGGGYPSPFAQGDFTPRFSPALADDAETLTLRVAELQWVRQEHASGQARVELTQPLGWVFEMPLSAGRPHVARRDPP